MTSSKSVNDVMDSYKGVHSSTMISILQMYEKMESKGDKWKRGEAQQTETDVIRIILKKRGVRYD